VNEPDPQFGNRSLIFDCRYNYLEMARMLIENGADVNRTAKDGSTAYRSCYYQLLKKEGKKMKKKEISGLLMILVLLVCFACAPAGPNMKEGQWEITTKMEMPGMPMQIPPQTRNQCLTKKDVVPQKVEPGQDCKMVTKKIKGDTVTWVMECETSEGPTVLDGHVTYKGEIFEGVIKMKQGGKEITQKLSGRWIGKCEE